MKVLAFNGVIYPNLIEYLKAKKDFSQKEFEARISAGRAAKKLSTSSHNPTTHLVQVSLENKSTKKYNAFAKAHKN